MDIDVIGKQIRDLLVFKDKIEGLMGGADGNVAKPSDQIGELLAFRSEFESAIPDLRKAITDVAGLVDDLGKIKADLAPVLAWVAKHQEALAAAKEPAAERSESEHSAG
jgi:hypothetical protein